MHRELICVIFCLSLTAVVSTVRAQPPAGWTASNIGSASPAGSVQYDKATETWTIRGAGTGIRGTADHFYFVHKTLSGDGELVARVASIDPPLSDWSMAGVMIRVLLTPDSPYAFMGVSANTDNQNHGITFWGRAAFGAVADHESTGATGAPCWVKIKRAGDTFAGYSSPDGKEWTERYSETAPGIPPGIYIGYVVTSEVAGKLLTAVFDRGPTTASSPSPADGAKHIVAPLLQWTAGATAVYHEVYVGTGPTLTQADYKGRLPATTPLYFHASGFVPGTAYYWRIDEVAVDGTVYTGDVWMFTSAPATAYAPRPWNGLDGVAVEADLEWTVGVGAISNDVYFGTDKAAVAAGDLSVFKGNQARMKYDPGVLAENTTYYWRIDEHDASGAVHPGEVWSFTTVGPGLGVKATYFRGTDPWGVPVLTRVEDAIDHAWGSGEVAGGLSDGVSARWRANLKAPFSETYQLITTSDDGVRLWLDGRLIIDNWTNHGSTDDMATVDLAAGQVYLLEMEWYDNTGSAVARLSWQSPSIPLQVIPSGPLQLPLRATGPYPAHNATDTPQSLELTWTAGDAAAKHRLYFGDDADAVADATPAGTGLLRETVTGTIFDPGPLAWNKTYFWRVDEVNDADAQSPWKGCLWSFTTADFLVVDDFEGFTDADGSRIYQTWSDGWTNGSGSQVGYIQPPFGEQKIVHAGRQSMPMDYNNVASPYYSEAERTWDSPQDWTVNGVDVLVLHIRGRAANTPAPLYVAIEDKAGHLGAVSHSDAAVVTTMQWVSWRIPLADLRAAGVNVAAVKTMRIGVGNRNKPAAGGAGRIYIDSIRVVKP